MILDKFFVGTELVEREVELGGEKHTLHFKELPSKVMFDLSLKVSDSETRLEGMQEAVQLSLCNPDGELALTAEQAANLKLGVLGSLADAVFLINGAKKN